MLVVACSGEGPLADDDGRVGLRGAVVVAREAEVPRPAGGRGGVLDV